MDLILHFDISFSDQVYLIFIAQLVSPDVSHGGIPQGPVPAHRLEQRVQCPDRKDKFSCTVNNSWSDTGLGWVRYKEIACNQNENDTLSI